MQSQTAWLLVVAMIIAGGVALLYVRSANDPEIEQNVAQLKTASLPLDARLVDSPPATRDANSFQASWTVETRESWAEYQNWLADHPPLDFRPAPAMQSTYLRTLPGDFQTLIIEKLSDGPPLRVKVSFRSIPD